MKVWGIGQVSDQEKKDILEKHRSLYDGYRTLQPQYASEQPLTVWDSAGDKAGITVNNRGEVKAYTNMNINESVEPQELDEANMCECGGMMYEGECSECGWKMEEVDEETQQVKDLSNVSDLNMKDSFDYVQGATNATDSFKISAHEDSAVDAAAMQDVTGQEAPHMADDMAPDGLDNDSDNNRKMMADGEIDEQGGNAFDMDVSDVESAYNFVSGGPFGGSDFANYSEEEIDEDSFTDLIDADNDLETDREELEEENPEFEYMESAWSDNKDFSMPGEDEDVYHQKDLDPDELDLDIEKFNPEDSSWEEIKAHTGMWDEIDEDLRESFVNQKQKIMEMMNRMKVL